MNRNRLFGKGGHRMQPGDLVALLQHEGWKDHVYSFRKTFGSPIEAEMAWCKENCRGRWAVFGNETGTYFLFLYDNDGVHFRLAFDLELVGRKK